jgi:hypothetical protein
MNVQPYLACTGRIWERRFGAARGPERRPEILGKNASASAVRLSGFGGLL